MHRYPFYPARAARRARRGSRTRSDPELAIEFRHAESKFWQASQGDCRTFADVIRPQLVLIGASFDAHYTNPIGNLGLETRTRAMTDRVREIAGFMPADGSSACWKAATTAGEWVNASRNTLRTCSTIQGPNQK